MDEIVRHLQGSLKKIALDRLSSVSVWMGVGGRQPMTVMDRLYRIMQMPEDVKTQEVTKPALPEAEVIEFYVPRNFVRLTRWTPEWRRGKVLPFDPRPKKTA